jgi:hypothetical protein
MWDTDKPAYGLNGTYNAFTYNERATSIINAHDASKPLFMYLAWQEAHTPNEVPDNFLSAAGVIDWPLRRTFEGIASAPQTPIQYLPVNFNQLDWLHSPI